jgi:hypothetical protein
LISVEIVAPQLGTFQVTDRFDFIGKDVQEQGIGPFTNFDFNFAAVFYCDPEKASSTRSMHQIDGKK